MGNVFEITKKKGDFFNLPLIFPNHFGMIKRSHPVNILVGLAFNSKCIKYHENGIIIFSYLFHLKNCSF